MRTSPLLPLLLALACTKPTVDTSPPAVDEDGDGYSVEDGDCDDLDEAVHPDAEESCNGLDDDCDGSIDEDAADAAWWYADSDGDGYGDPDQGVQACEAPEGFVDNGGDCDDTDAFIHPDSSEVCNGLDDDCDDEVDEEIGELWYLDADGDGWGDEAETLTACDPPSGYTGLPGDCDDQDASVYPDAEEICDGLDQDCDGEIDEGVLLDFYVDADGDGYGDASSTGQACEPGSGLVVDDSDCDDSNAWVNPGVASDDCNAVDDDCDGDIDEDVEAGWMLVTVDGGDDAIYEIDTATAAMTLIAELDDPSLGNINTMDVNEDGVTVIHSVDQSALVTLDICSGTSSVIGDTGVGNTNGIAFDAADVLYGIDTDNDQLVWYDTTTGAGTVIGPLGFALGNGGLAYDCTSDTLYGVDGSTASIFVLNRSTGAAGGFVSTSVPFSAVGIEFDHATGTLFASTGSALYQVDPATGSSTYIGSVSTSEGVNDLAFHPTCP